MQPKICQVFVSYLIFLLTFLCIVLSTVKFNNQFCLRTDKVYDIVANGLLPIELKPFKLLASYARP